MKKLLVLLCLASVASAQTYYNKTTVPPLSEFYITAYGAKCNGVADDTAGLQAAAAAANTAGGGTIIIPAGNCVISNTTTLHSNTTVSGYGGTLTAVAPGSWAGTVNEQAFILAASSSNVTIQGIYFSYPVSNGGCQVITLNTTSSRITIKDNISNNCGDFVANTGGTDVLITHNRAYNCTNACYDNWSNATNTTITDNLATALGANSRGIEFTGLTTALTAATSTNLVATGNTIYLLSTSQQGINVDGLTSSCAGNAAQTYGTIANNHIFSTSGHATYGILLRFCSNNWNVHDNIIISDGTSMSDAAIAANSDSNNVRIHHNHVYNWNNQLSGANRGLFRNASVGGTLEFNECYSCTTATTLVGVVDSTTLNLGNDTGTGAISATLGTITLSPGTSISQATWGTAGIAFVGSAFTANDTTTGSGGVASDVAYNFASPTFTNTQGTANTLTNAVTLRVAPPICGSGWAGCTNLYSQINTGRTQLALGADIAGATVNINSATSSAVTIGNGGANVTLNASTLSGTGTTVNINKDASTDTTNIGTGTTSGLVTIGGGSDNVTVNAGTLSLTGTLAGTTMSNYLASPSAIGGSSPAAITGTTITGTTVAASTASNLTAGGYHVPYNLSVTGIPDW